MSERLSRRHKYDVTLYELAQEIKGYLGFAQKVKVKADIALHGTSLAIWDHTVLPGYLPPDTSECAPPITPAMQAGIRFTYPGLARRGGRLS